MSVSDVLVMLHREFYVAPSARPAKAARAVCARKIMVAVWLGELTVISRCLADVFVFYYYFTLHTRGDWATGI